MSIPLTPLSVTPILPPTPLPKPSPPPTYTQFVSSIPPFRLNLLTTDNVHLYFPYSSSHVAVYRISRSNGVKLVPHAAPQIQPETTINNARMIGDTLLMTGGHERVNAPASISVLRRNGSKAKTVALPWISAWGLDVRGELVAVSCNSRRIAVMDMKGVLEGEGITVMPRVHRDNIPCVAFSRCGRYLASASIDTTFAVYDVERESVVFRSMEPRIVPEDNETDVVEQRCWCVHWVGGVVVVDEEDEVWRRREVQGGGVGIEDPATWFRGECELFEGGGVKSLGGVLLNDGEEGLRGHCEGDVGDIVEGGRGYKGRVYQGGLGFKVGGWEGERRGEGKLLLVGRHNKLSLFVVEGGRVRKLDSVFLRVEGLMYSWCTDVKEVEELKVIVISVKGFGVVLLRVVCGEGGIETARLFVERVFARRMGGRGLLPWQRSMHDVIGTAVVDRGEEGDYAAELWILWQDAVIECWELERGRLCVDPGTRAV